MSKRKEKEREEERMNQFLHNSLRASDRLRALEKSNRINYKMNAAFMPEDLDSEMPGMDIGEYFFVCPF